MKILLSLFIPVWLLAAGTSSVEDVLQSIYPDLTRVEKKSAIIPKDVARAVQEQARTKLTSRLVRYYRIYHGDEMDLAIVMTQKVRTKRMAALYIIEKGHIKHIEMLAFSEPPEYKPSPNWLGQFREKRLSPSLNVGEALAAKSGATLSANAVTKGARIALALYPYLLKEK